MFEIWFKDLISRLDFEYFYFWIDIMPMYGRDVTLSEFNLWKM